MPPDEEEESLMAILLTAPVYCQCQPIKKAPVSRSLPRPVESYPTLAGGAMSRGIPGTNLIFSLDCGGVKLGHIK